MNVSKVTVLKSKSVEKQKNRWEKIEYGLEIDLSPKDNPELAKEMGNTLLDSWLREGEPVKPTSQKPSTSRGRTKAEREGWTKTCASPNCNKLISDSFTYCFLCNKKLKENWGKKGVKAF